MNIPFVARIASTSKKGVALRLLHLLVLATTAALTASYAFAQAPGKTAVPASALKAFEVATVKISSPDHAGKLAEPGGTRFDTTGMPLSILLQMAFGLEDSQISGPTWIRTQTYDIAAKTEGGAVLTYEQTKPLLQRLLVERLKLTYHYETKDRPGYVLVAAKGGAKLQPAKEGASKGGDIRPNAIQTDSTTMTNLAKMLALPLRKPVMDETGIIGDYAVHLSFATLEATESDLPSIFAAVQEQLGLKLESAKVPEKILVIDHAEKVPTED